MELAPDSSDSDTDYTKHRKRGDSAASMDYFELGTGTTTSGEGGGKKEVDKSRWSKVRKSRRKSEGGNGYGRV